MTQHDDDIIPHQDETEQVIENELIRVPKLFDIAPHIVEASGWLATGWDASYITPTGELVAFFDIAHAGALALDPGDELVMGTLPPALRIPPGYFTETAQVGIYPGWDIVGGLVQIMENGNIRWARSHPSHVSAVGFGVEAYNIRWPLADVDAARALVLP